MILTKIALVRRIGSERKFTHDEQYLFDNLKV
jgi:hypothetical protein